MADTLGGMSSNSAKFYVDLVVRNMTGIQQAANQSINQIASKTNKSLSTQGIIMGSALGNALGMGIAKSTLHIWDNLNQMIMKSGLSASIKSAMLDISTKIATPFLDLKNNIGKLLILITGVIATIKTIGKSVGAWANFNEELNKTQVLFRDATVTAERFANSISKSYGIARIDVLKLASDIQNTIIPFITTKNMSGKGYDFSKTNIMTETGGTNRQFAAGISTQLSQRVMDIASLRNLNIDEVAVLMSSAIIRGGRAAQSLGAAMSAAEVEALALERTGKSRAKQLTIEEKQYARIELILQRTADAEGDMMRTAGSIANAWRNIRGTFTETLTIIGAVVDSIDIGGMLLNIADTIKIINSLLTVMATIGQRGIKPIFQTVFDSMNISLKAILLFLDKTGQSISEIMRQSAEPPTKGVEKAKKQYEAMVQEIETLRRLQKQTGKDYSSDIAFAESIARFWANRVENMGGEIEIVDTFTGLNDELEETEKLTNSIHNNLLKIGDDMQEALLDAKFDLSDVNINKYVNGMSSNTSNVDFFNVGAELGEILKSNMETVRVLKEILFEQKRGIYN